jgi:hypothetical protein
VFLKTVWLRHYIALRGPPGGARMAWRGPVIACFVEKKNIFLVLKAVDLNKLVQ